MRGWKRSMTYKVSHLEVSHLVTRTNERPKVHLSRSPWYRPLVSLLYVTLVPYIKVPKKGRRSVVTRTWKGSGEWRIMWWERYLERKWIQRLLVRKRKGEVPIPIIVIGWKRRSSNNFKRNTKTTCGEETFLIQWNNLSLLWVKHDREKVVLVLNIWVLIVWPICLSSRKYVVTFICFIPMYRM